MNGILNNVLSLCAVVVAVALLVVKNIGGDKTSDLLNVSYDPTRELFAERIPARC
jgi:ABC-type sulfate transport system substrate-binding protein